MGDSITYDQDVFACDTIEAARQIILEPEAGLSTDQRWWNESFYLARRIVWPDNTRLIIDYGCGIGRMMPFMQPAVLGVDFSPKMRQQGEECLRHIRQDCGFVSPECFQLLCERGLRAQGAMAVWALQHMPAPDQHIRLVFNALPIGAPFYVVNRDNRAVPVRKDGARGWGTDGVDVWQALEAGGFVLVHEEPMPETLCAPGAWFRKYERAAL